MKIKTRNWSKCFLVLRSFREENLHHLPPVKRAIMGEPGAVYSFIEDLALSSLD